MQRVPITKAEFLEATRGREHSTVSRSVDRVVFRWIIDGVIFEEDTMCGMKAKHYVVGFAQHLGKWLDD